MSFATHLESAIDGTRLPARTIQTTHEGRPLWMRYDLEAVRAAVTREDVKRRPPTLWRYRELLPVDDDDSITSLGEGMTPLIACDRLGALMGLERLIIKDESQLPTGSFKSRGLCMAISMAKQLGVKRVAIPTAGNAGGAMAAYAARAGMESYVFMPEDTPAINQAEAKLFGAHVFLVNGLITDCGAIVREGAERFDWFDVSTLKEPYRLEGKKTMGLELAEQLDWTLPDAILYPTGGGTGLIGMWKAFEELSTLGWIEGRHKPRMFACQSDGCAPIVHAFENGDRFAEAPESPHTRASGLRVPKAVGDFMILDAVRASEGAAVAGRESAIELWMSRAAALEGVSLCPEAAICLDALTQAIERGLVSSSDQIVVFNTGAAQKYPETLTLPTERLDRDDVDWSVIEKASTAC